MGHGIASRMLAKHVGQPYAPIQNDATYGKFIGEEKLSNGMVSLTEAFNSKDRDVYMDEVDSVVRTKNDEPYTVWKNAKS